MIKFTDYKISFSAIITILGIAGLLGLFLFLHDFVQIWDGHLMINCALAAANYNSSLLNFTCAGPHYRSGPYLAILGKIVLIDTDIPSLPILFQLCCLIISGVYFSKLLNLLFAQKNLNTEKALLLLQFYFSPLVAANLFYISLDFPILCLTPIFLFYLLSKKYLLAGFCGTAAYFCKTTGVLYLQFIAVLYILVLIVHGLINKHKLNFRFSLVFLFLPTFVHNLISVTIAKRPIIFGALNTKPKFCWSDAKTLSELFLNLDLNNKYVQNYLFNIFAINFSWIGSVLILVCTIKILFLFFNKNNITKYFDLNMFFMILSLFAGAYIFTRCTHYSNPKYIIGVIPVFICVYFFCLFRLLPNLPQARFFIIISFLALQLLSIFRTIDPVSKKFYGTFSFGEHSLLHMTSRTNEYCGAGRDQTVYNLEFTKYHFLLNKIFNEINPSEKDVISADPDALWRLLGTGFNKETQTRSSFRSHSTPRFVSHYNALTEKIEGRLFFIEFPFILDKRGSLLLSQKFKVLDKKNYDLAGYALEVTEFSTLKN